MSEAIRKKFQKLVRQLGRLMLAEADKGLAGKKSKRKAKAKAYPSAWVSAFLDARWFSDAEGYTAKLRFVLPDGSLFGVQTTSDMSALLKKIWNVRKEDSFAAWFGLKVTVTPDRKIATDLDNDPKCVVDPTWFYS
jgi:hypothetical protein